MKKDWKKIGSLFRSFSVKKDCKKKRLNSFSVNDDDDDEMNEKKKHEDFKKEWWQEVKKHEDNIKED